MGPQRRTLTLCTALLPVFLTGCLQSPFSLFSSGGDAPTPSPSPGSSAVAVSGGPRDAQPDSPILGKKIILPSGLIYIDLALGTGATPRPGQRVQVHYTQTLDDGVTIDSTRGGDPLAFTLGVGEVIEGWDEGLKTMRVGGRRQLIVPPSLAFGDEGRLEVIPPGATLICDIELLEILEAGEPLE